MEAQVQAHVLRKKKLAVLTLIQSVFQTECNFSTVGIYIGYFRVFINNRLSFMCVDAPAHQAAPRRVALCHVRDNIVVMQSS